MHKFLLPLLGIVLLLEGCGKGRFADFPVNKTYTVNFNFPDLSREEFSDREKGDQAKDWLLYSLLSNAGLSRKEFAEATFDLAPVRYGFNATLANFDYGPTRSKFIGNGEVVALLPVSDSITRNNNIAHILDETRKDQGEKPKKLYVFEYDLNTEGRFSKLTRKDNIDAALYFTETMGYYENNISSLEDLQQFMQHTDDITYARQDQQGLVFGGRRIAGQPYGKVQVEDVASIWQSERYINNKQEQSQLEKDTFEDKLKEQTDSVNDVYNDALKSVVFADGQAYADLDVPEKNKIVKDVQSGIDADPGTDYAHINESVYSSDKKIVRLISAFRNALNKLDSRQLRQEDDFYKGRESDRVASASGFSLDPAIDYERSIGFVQEHLSYFASALRPEFTVQQLLEQLKDKDDDLMLYALAKMSKQKDELSAFVSDAGMKACKYQRARYDGKLKGTAVGMTLFYTDLLAKMWAANMFDSHPDVNIAGFRNLEQTKMVRAAIFNTEAKELPSCRLWFGPNKNGFQISGFDKSAINFSRNATQIFALSANPADSTDIDSTGKSKHREVQAAQEFDVVLSWWNDHYEEIGQFEPQYQRLNEIMKWSTIIQWLNSHTETSASIGFLNNYAVADNNWFPDWVTTQKDLKFNNWDSFSFFQAGSFGSKTESMPILVSTNHMFVGGVSLAEKSLIKEAPDVLGAEQSLVRRSNIAADINQTGEDAFVTFKDTKINLAENVQNKTVDIELNPKEGFKLRNRFGEVANKKFEWRITEDPAGSFAVQNNFDGIPVGRLSVSELEKNGFSIGFESQAVDKGMAIAKQCSDAVEETGAFLKKCPGVERHFLSTDGNWYVQPKNSENWMVMRVTPEDMPGAINLEEGWMARTSGSESRSKIIELKWVDQEAATKMSGNMLPSRYGTADLLDESPLSLEKELVKTKGEAGAKAALKKIKEDGLAEVNQLELHEEFEKAGIQTEKLIRHFGETPELVALQIKYNLKTGLQAIETNNFGKAVGCFNEAFTTRPAGVNSADILDEINGILDKSSISASRKMQIAEMGKAYFTDEQMFIAGEWEGYKSIAKPATLESALSRKGVKIIYPHNDAFINIDPAASFQTIAEQIRSIPNAHVYELSAEAIGKNTRLYAAVDHVQVFDFTVQRLQFRISPGSALTNCREKDKDGNCKDEYSVRGPVYFIDAPSAN